LLVYPVHKGLQKLVKDLNHIYRNEEAFYENQFSTEGFEWIQADDMDNSVYIYLRKGERKDDACMVILNLTPRVIDYKIGVTAGSHWEVVFNSDDEQYAGSGVKADIFDEQHEEFMGHQKSISINLPPLAGIILKRKDKKYKQNRIKHHKR
jgi:1,4-alpha-glucan branching enzyme